MNMNHLALFRGRQELYSHNKEHLLRTRSLYEPPTRQLTSYLIWFTTAVYDVDKLPHRSSVPIRCSGEQTVKNVAGRERRAVWANFVIYWTAGRRFILTRKHCYTSCSRFSVRPICRLASLLLNNCYLQLSHSINDIPSSFYYLNKTSHDSL